MKLLLTKALFGLSIAYCLASTFWTQTVHAEGEFTTDYETTYVIDKNGNAKVTQKISLTNNLSTVYATSYLLSFEGKKPTNIRASESDRKVPFEANIENNTANINLSFETAVVGKGKVRTFQVSYTLENFATHSGQVWELNIPRLSDPESVAGYKLIVKTAKEIGQPAYLSPKPEEHTEEGSGFNAFFFAGEEIKSTGVVAAFGDFQVFSFKIDYHLKNPHAVKFGKTEVALIPDTAFQKIYYEKIEPKPEKVRLDADGNWLATYTLKPGQKLDIATSGNIQSFSQPQSQDNYPPNAPPAQLLGPSAYWQVADPEILSLAKIHKTPEQIYNFVTSTLNYDYTKVIEGTERLGAKRALENPDQAVCTEFTDLFVTLARAAGIPAREINGYAYTDNPEIQPLSLVADVLHAWPEYYDAETKVWKPVDPTWGKTTGGVDYFNKFDLTHITFAIHGKSAENPAAAGSYKSDRDQKDISISFGELPDKRSTSANILFQPLKLSWPFTPSKLRVRVTNPGPIALYNQNVALSAKNTDVKKLETTNIPFIAPYDSQEFDIRLTTNSWDSRTSQIFLTVGENSTSFVVPKARVALLQSATILVSLLTLLGSGWITTHLMSRKRNK